MLPFSRKRRAIYPWLLAGLMEMAVVTPWMILIYSWEMHNWIDALPSAWILLLPFLGAALWEAGSTDPAGRTPVRRIAPLVGGVFLMYGIAYLYLPAPMREGIFNANLGMAIVPVAAYLWYQGASSASEGLEYTAVFIRFRNASLILGVALLFNILSGIAALGAVQVILYWSVILFFVAGLSLLVVSRERSLRTEQAEMGEEGAGGEETSPMLTGVVIGLLLLTLGASYLVSVEGLRAFVGGVSSVVGTALTFLVDLFMLLAYRWIYLLGLVLERFLKWLMRNAVEPEPQDLDGAAGEAPDIPFGEVPEPMDLEPYYPIMKAIYLALLVAGTAYMLYRMGARSRRQSNQEEERINLGFWANFLADLRGLFRRPADETATDGPAAGSAEVFDPKDPRALYRRLQRWGAEQVRPRRAAETPTRYGKELVGRRPEAAVPVTVVTALYNQARYGNRAAEPEAVQSALTVLEVLDAPAAEQKTGREKA
jgi:hypothetical protein